jgi:hypothetical protein
VARLTGGGEFGRRCSQWLRGSDEQFCRIDVTHARKTKRGERRRSWAIYSRLCLGGGARVWLRGGDRTAREAAMPGEEFLHWRTGMTGGPRALATKGREGDTLSEKAGMGQGRNQNWAGMVPLGLF